MDDPWKEVLREQRKIIADWWRRLRYELGPAEARSLWRNHRNRLEGKDD
jgi:hypothetical protein